MPHRVREKHLQNKFKPVLGKPWAQELSGRALSLALDIREKAQSEAQKLSDRGDRKFEFHHVAHGPANRLAEHGNLGVFIEPVDGDVAHANLVIIMLPGSPPRLERSAAPKESIAIYREIARLLDVCDASDLASLEALRVPPIQPHSAD